MFSNFIDSLRLPFQKDKNLRRQLRDIFGFYPHNLEVYRIALAHKSHVYRNRKGRSYNNERLEFLGDAILEAVVSDIVFHRYENRPEGFLTSTRSKIVQRATLNRLARDLGIEALIRAPKHRGHNSYIGGNAFEALVGAAYVDRGYKCCQWFVARKIIGKLIDLDGLANREVNFKSKLLEWCQKNKIESHFRDTEASEAATGSPVFHSKVKIEGLTAGEGKGYSKKESQQVAAREALTKLRREPQFIDSIFGEKEKRTAMEAVQICVLPKIDVIEEAIEAEKKAKAESRRSTPQKQKGTAKQTAGAKKQNTPTPASAKEENATAEKPKGNSRRRAQSRPAKAVEAAPVSEKAAAASEKAAPAPEKAAPAPEKAAPVAEKAAAVVAETPSAPVEKEPAPVVEKSAPVEEKSSSIEEKSAPVETAQQAEQPAEAAAQTAKPRKGRRGAARRSPNRPATPQPEEKAAAEPVAEAKQEVAAPAKDSVVPAKETAAPAKAAAAPAKEERNSAKAAVAPVKEVAEPAKETVEPAKDAAAPAEPSKSAEAPAKRRTSPRRPRAQRPQLSPEEQAAAEQAREELIRAAEEAAFAEKA